MSFFLIIIAILIVFISVVAFIIFLIKSIKSYTSSQGEKGIAESVSATGLLLITSSFGTLWSNSFNVISILTISNSVDDTERINNIFTETQWGQLVIGFILLALGVYLQKILRSKIFILNINTYYDQRIESNNNNLKLSTFEFKEREIDLTRVFNNGLKTDIKDVSKDLTEIIEEKVKSFKNESLNFKRGYTGIAAIPLVMFAGTFLKREKIDEFYEFDKVTNETYYKLKNKGEYPPLLYSYSSNALSSNNKEVIIAVSLTRKISDHQMKQFKDCELIDVYLEEPKDNTIQNKEQLFNYARHIAKVIEEASSNNQIIHLLISSQSCLVLEIGKRIENQRMAKVICYYFDIKSTPIYPWGIIMNGNDKGEFFKYEE